MAQNPGELRELGRKLDEAQKLREEAQALLAEVKAKPGTVNFASAGTPTVVEAGGGHEPRGLRGGVFAV